jgi:hypothetical protein
MSPTRTAEQAEAAYCELATIAHHEAAHAVIGRHLGLQVFKIQLWQVRPNYWRGHVTWSVVPDDQGNRAEAVASLVGEPAELRWLEANGVPAERRPHDVFDSSREDRNRVGDLLAWITPAERPTFREVEREAAALVVRHWGRIEHLAARLIEPRLHQIQP